MEKIDVVTSKRQQFTDITHQIQNAVSASGMHDGIVCIFVPHTTAGVTINENADPDVVSDVLMTYSRLIPNLLEYRHVEGNSDSHVKSSLTGCSLTVIVEQGRLQLGTWQSIYFAEFDGPRRRHVWIKMINT